MEGNGNIYEKYNFKKFQIFLRLQVCTEQLNMEFDRKQWLQHINLKIKFTTCFFLNSRVSYFSKSAEMVKKAQTLKAP